MHRKRFTLNVTKREPQSATAPKFFASRRATVFAGDPPPPLAFGRRGDLRRGRLFLHERQERFVAGGFHSIYRNKMERGRVDDIALSGGRS
jgi:hypothetical protein